MAGKIILASSSPRRADILKKLNIGFEIIPSPYVEDHTRTVFSYDFIEKLAYNKALEEVNKWLNGELTRKPRIGFAGEFGFTDIVSSQKYGLKKGLGVDIDKIQKILDNDKLSDEQKRKKIQKLVNKYEKQLRIKEHRLTAKQQVREESIYGATHEDRQAMAIKVERDQYEKASKKVNAKLEKLLKWAQNKDNAEALNMQELINAVANGDTE